MLIRESAQIQVTYFTHLPVQLFTNPLGILTCYSTANAAKCISICEVNAQECTQVNLHLSNLDEKSQH